MNWERNESKDDDEQKEEEEDENQTKATQCVRALCKGNKYKQKWTSGWIDG